MTDEFTAADAALDAVLSTPGAPAAEPDAAVADLPLVTTERGSTDVDQWLCTPDEARAMVERTRAAITELDTSLREIVERRAWEPLGYADAKEFVLAELGPTAEGGKSRAQAYRLARLAMFFYQLGEAFGDTSPLLDITERSLRALPAGANGENDEVLVDRLYERISALDEPTEEQVKGIWDEEYESARDEIAKTGRLARRDEHGSGWDGQGSANAQWDDLSGDDGGEYRPDDFDVAAITSTDDDTDDAGESKPEWETASSSRLDYAEAHGVGERASEETKDYLAALRALMDALATISETTSRLPDIVEYASDEEIVKAAELAHTTQTMTAALVDAAKERDTDLEWVG